MTKKIAFIQDELRTRQGIMILSAVLKGKGHATDVFILSGHKVSQEIKGFNPDIIAFSLMTPGFSNAIKWIKRLKADNNSKYFIIMGGSHTTVYPECIETEKSLDAICIGEGEEALVELADNLSSNSIKNLWIRKDNTIYKNPVRNLIKDLDYLPNPDYKIYRKFPQLLKSNTKTFMLSRGCPFNCSYCFNKRIRDIYNGKGSWVRFKSNKKIISEILEIKETYGMKWVQFNDDTFNINPRQLYSFLEEYKRKVNIPFLCNLRIDMTDKKMIEELKRAGVNRIDTGIEHGNEKFRSKILNRKMKNSHIIDFGNWIQENQIRLHTANIMGFPGETLSMAFETIELNAKLKPEKADCGILQPFPGTEIINYVKTHGYVKKNISFKDMKGQKTWSSFGTQSGVKSVINQNNIKELINLHCFFDLLVKHLWLKPFIKILIKLPYNRGFQFIYQWGIFKVHWKYTSNCKERIALLRRLFSIFY